MVPPGRPLLQRIIQLTHKVTKPHHHIKFNAGFREDIRIWQVFLSKWNGCNFFMQSEWGTSETLRLYTDAASTLAFGGIYGNQLFQGTSALDQMVSCPGISIDWQELYTIVIACKIWGKHWSRRRIIIFHCNNKRVVDVINSKHYKSPKIMALVHTLTFLTFEYNFYFKAYHIPGTHNSIADRISRFQMEEFRTLAPQIRHSIKDIRTCS